ncbi:MAG: hypothetical protein PHS07_01805 [Patescibacteria group bacterium]|jgi:hypothetical protein|nr:hypothetical protein [Patescibacteria group bacterium]
MFLTPILAQANSEELAGLVDKVNLSNPSWDLFIILLFVIVAFFYGISLGRDRVLVILVSIYMATAVAKFIPNVGNISAMVGAGDQQFVFQVTFFLVLFIIMFIFLSRSALLKTIASSESQTNWFQSVVFSFLHIGLLISITLSFLPEESLSSLSYLTKNIFTNEWARLAWLCVPVLLMAIVGGKKKKHSKKRDYDDDENY